MKEELCRAFCGDLSVSDVPAGWAVRTAFKRGDGDAIAFYVVRDERNPALVRLEDDGDTIPYLDASGVDLTEGPRAEMFSALLREHQAEFDPEEYVLHTGFMPADQLPAAAMRFVALLLRMQDFLLVTRERIEDTFKADVIKAVTERFSGRAEVELDHTLNERLRHFPADIVVRAPGFIPLAIFIGTSETKALEALLFWLETTLRKAAQCKTMLVLDKAKSPKIKERTLARVMNSGIPIAAFRDEESEAIDFIERQFFQSGAYMMQ